MFVLVADILDSFGDLVFERLKLKATDDPSLKKNNNNIKPVKKRELRKNFTHIDVNLEAKETCQNWFYKIACIRELLPRLFIELCLIKCWRFIRPPEDFEEILTRLAKMLRGIGDPLVSAYGRAYLVHRGFESMQEKMRPIMLQTFDDFLFTFHEIEKKNFKSIECVQKKIITEKEYIDLYSPCLEWVVQCIAFRASEEEFFGLIQRYKDGWNNIIILLHILSRFNDKYISKHAKGISRLIKESFVTTVNRSKLYLELGRSIVCIAPPQKHRLQLLNDIWKVVSKIKEPIEYMMVSAVYIEYLLQHFTVNEIDILLGDVIKHLKKGLEIQDVKIQDELFKIVNHILKYIVNFKELFTIFNFLPLIDMLQKSYKLQACKLVMEKFKRNCNQGIKDAVLINSLMDISRMLHDSIDYLTPKDEQRQITELICHLIDYIDYGHELERLFNEYIECRNTFSNLDGVIYLLITKVGNLCMLAHKLMNGKHNKKTSTFVKACLAYCHVTIPSLELVWPRLYLFCNLGQIALVNNMINQAEAFFIAAILLIPKLPNTFTAQYSNQIQSTPALLSEYIETFCSTIIVMPGHPEKGPFYLLQLLKENLLKFSLWKDGNINQYKIKAFIGIFKCLCTYSQKEFPYNIDNVSSNDKLYGQISKYMNLCFKELNDLGKSIHEQILQLSDTGKSLDKQAQGYLSLYFINTIIDFIILTNKSNKIIIKLHETALKAPNLNKNYYNNTMIHIKQKNLLLYETLIQQKNNM